MTNQYDANGNLVSFFDKTGQRWTKTFDRLNRAIAESDPLGDTKTTAYDVADRVRQITSPNGYPSLHTYDGRGRLIKWVDPMNFPWIYAYDGVGNITNITDALGGHYVMAYGSRNERTMEQNQDTNTWHYTYDELLRLKQQTDPNGITRTPRYDKAGRVLFVDFSTGRSDEFSYDPNDNPQTVSRTGSGVPTTTQFIYDSLDRVIEQDDALGKTVLYGYDPLSRVTAITYPGNKMLTNFYDPLGRLTNQVDWAGRRMAYTYDLADRLISRKYPNGIVQTNTFDSAGRISGLNYSPTTVNSNSINIALAYAYDRNGNKTGSSESGTFNWPQPSLTDDQSSFTPAGRLVNRQVQNTISNQLSTINYSYDSSGNMTNAVMTGGVTAQSWTLAYDEDNRTTSIQWISGVTNKLIANRYDALGRRISKTVNGVTTGYVLSLAGGMEKVLCDLDGNNNVTAWYVHGPDLCYRVDSNNGLLCYHADAQANIIALTDGNTNLVAQYAYTPYGRSLGSTNLSTINFQPYTFVGSQGVQEESDIPNLYFMRARYYSADAGVFLSTDPVKHIGAGWSPIAYSYAGLNPISQSDPNGQLFGEDDLWFLGIGAVVGTIDQAEDDIIHQHYSGLQSYLASAWGGAVGEDLYGNTIELTGNPYLAGYVGGAANAFAKDTFNSGVDSLTGTKNNTTLTTLAEDMGKSGLGGLASAGISQTLPISGLNGEVSGKIFEDTFDNTTVNGAGAIIGNSLQSKPLNVSSSGGNQSMSSQTVGAMCYATTVTAATSTPRASPTTQSGTTTTSGGTSATSSSSGGSRSSSGNTTSTQTTSQSPANSGTSFLGQVGSAISKAVTSIGNFFSSFFR